MRIAVYHNLPSGGAKRALYEITRRLAERHIVDVYTLSSAEHEFCDLRPHCNQHVVTEFTPIPLARPPIGRLNQAIRSADLLRLAAVQRGISRRIDSLHYDVVFMHHCRFGQSPAISQYLRTPSVYYCQEPPRHVYEPRAPRPYNALPRWKTVVNYFDPLPGLYRGLLSRIDCVNVRAATVVLTNSAYSRESLYRTYGIMSHIAYLGVDTDKFRPEKVADGQFLLSVGALLPNKGFDFLIHSLSRVHGDMVCLAIVSNYATPEERSYLLALAERLGIQVALYTMVSDEQLVALYNAARFVAYAPIMEPFGFVPLEAMACGKAVIGVLEGGVRETVLHDQTGLLIERDPQAFGEAIERLLGDPDRARQYGKAGRQVAEECWQWSRSVKRIEHWLEEAANRAGSWA